MATYSGALASNGLPELADEGEVDSPAMTLRRAQHVYVVNESGEAATQTPEDEKPGSSIDNPLYTSSADDLPDPVVPAWSNDQRALIVTTTAQKLASARADRKSIVIVNNSTGTLYLGREQSVSASGPKMGLAISAGGSYSDSGFGVWVGETWGIYSAVATAENVAVSDRA